MEKLNLDNYVKDPETSIVGNIDIKSQIHKKSEIKKSPGIYFLLSDDNDIIYIGSSKDPFSRITQHYNDKRIPFINYFIEYLPESEYDMLEIIEYDFILKYCPKYNLKLEHDRWMTEYRIIKLFKKEYGANISTLQFRELVSSNGVRYTIYNNCILYDMVNVMEYIFDEYGDNLYE